MRALRPVFVLLLLASAAPLRAEEPGYEFTQDWVSRDAEIWKTHLQPLIGRPGLRAVEIGSFEGRSALWFLENVLTDDSAHLTCIDPFPVPEVEARFDRNIERSGLGAKVTKRKGFSQFVLRELEVGAFDFVYIDGCHEATCVLTDAVLSFDLVKPGGLLIFDDYGFGARMGYPPNRRPRVAIDGFLHVFQHQLEVLHKRPSVVVVRRLEEPRP